MKLEEQNILFISRSTSHGGTENVILQLCEVLKPHTNKVIVCTANGINSKILSDMGIKFYSIPDIEKKDLGTINKVISTIKRIIKRENITVIHIHHRMAAFYVSLLGLYKKCTFIATGHNTFYDKKALTRFSYKHCNVIACGDMVKRNLTDYYKLPESQVTVIHNAIKPFDGQLVSIKEIQDARNEGYTVIGNIGRFSEQKGMKYYIRAARKVVNKNKKVCFFIIGDGEERKKIESMVNQYFPNGEMKMLGYRTDIQNVMSQLDFIVLSSLWEGLPLTPIEAFSVGKTVVATAVDGTLEIVRNNQNGLLVQSKNVEELAEAILQLVDHPELVCKLEKKAYETYKNEFSFQTLSNQYINYYENI